MYDAGAAAPILPRVVLSSSTPAGGLGVEQPPPSLSSCGLVVSAFGTPAPKRCAPFPCCKSERDERERAQREREKEREQERRRKSSIPQAQQVQAERRRLQGKWLQLDGLDQRMGSCRNACW